MTSEPGVATIALARALPHQVPVLVSPARFKVIPWGRRTGKSRISWGCSIDGHGPRDAQHRPKWSGILQGRDVAWIAPDFPQSRTLWEEEVIPRFEHVNGCYINEQKKVVRIRGLGALWIKSFENIRSVRGIGARLGGIVCEECAHWDLGYAWRSVLRPALMDNAGWALFPSSPNYLLDGNKELQTPSFYNRLCDQVAAGARGPDWEMWEGDARMNPKIVPSEFAELVAEYEPESDELKQEVYGLRLTTGVGLAFPEYKHAVHVRPWEPDADDACGAGMDWGFSAPGWFGIFYQGRRRLLLRRELYFKGKPARLVGREIAMLCIGLAAEGVKYPHEVMLDEACFTPDDEHVDIAEKLKEGVDAAWAEYEWPPELQLRGIPPAPTFLPAPKGPGSIRTRTLLLKEALHHTRDVDGTLVEPPRLYIHPDCKDFLRVVAKIPLDPKKSEQFNTAVEDHPIDGATYFLISRSAEWLGSQAPSRRVQEIRKKLDRLSQAEAQSWDKLERQMQKRGRAVR